MQLALRERDGATLREHLQAAVAAGGAVDPRLTAEPPPEGSALWSVFVDLSSARPMGMGGAGTVPPSEILAWQQLHGVQLSGWELDTLAAMDRAAMAVQAEHQRANSPANNARKPR